MAGTRTPLRIVSIPFKRERASQRVIIVSITSGGVFPFPSNGSAHLNLSDLSDDEKHEAVRFPFPSNGRAHLNMADLLNKQGGRMFPFPSNGRARLNSATKRLAGWRSHSFHSLQTGERVSTYVITNGWSPTSRGFHSLQTGERVSTQPSPVHSALPSPEDVSIPFKRDSASQLDNESQKWESNIEASISVSIPFKRESASQPYYRACKYKHKLPGFHSLQTGERVYLQ